MCKLFAIVEIENQKNAELFTKCAIPSITKTDNHGLGIMRLGEKGVHLQRWLTPPTVLRKRFSKKMQTYEKALKHQHNESGNQSKKLYAIAVHGRFATCERSLENTHPFYKDGTALMHNGVITNADKFTRTLSTCDSEALLSQYLEAGVRENNNKLEKALDGVSGYYAAIVFNDNGIIDIFRDDTATLFLGHVRDVGVVIATTAEIITSAAKACKAVVTGIDEILPNTVIRWDKGVYPQISQFELEEEIYQYTASNSAFGTDLDLELHQRSVSDAEHWWDVENKEDREAQRIREWKEQEDQDQKDLQKYWDERTRKQGAQ